MLGRARGNNMKYPNTGVFETIRKSEVCEPEKVFEISESRDQKNKNKIKGKNEIFVFIIHPWGQAEKGF